MNPEYQVVDTEYTVVDLPIPGAIKIEPANTYQITWAPTQAELTQCEQAHKLYIILSRVEETGKDALERLHLSPSDYCVILYVQPDVSDEHAEAWVRQRFDALCRGDMTPTPWFAPAGLNRGKLPHA